MAIIELCTAADEHGFSQLTIAETTHPVLMVAAIGLAGFIKDHFMLRSSGLRFRSLLAVGLCGLITTGCGDRGGADPVPKSAAESAAVNSADEIATIRTFCADCHAFPKPQSFPKDEWKAEVAQGFRLYYDSPTEGLKIPSEDATVAYFESLAPEHRKLPDTSAKVEVDRFQLDKQTADDHALATSVSCVRFDPESQLLWACDMRNGSLLSAQPGGPFQVAARPLELLNPCRITPVDLDGDGVREILVSDLGSFLPQDHQQGAVWSFSPENSWAATPILSSAARVSDVQPGDLDGDGDLDLVVAQFGWRRTGRIVVLWNEGDETWREQVLDKRHGAIDVPIVDLNADGRPDIVALLAQEHELVVAYLNQGDGTFQTDVLYDAEDPSFGSSGLQAVDFDADGDIDFLHTNGDSFDDGNLKPFHGIRWLENNGQNQFEVRELALMPGVHRAVAGDVDLDGDTDVVAVSLLPPTSHSTPGIPSILWLEQTTGGAFLKHVVEIDRADHASCELVDRDNDGDLDLCTTNFLWTNDQGPPVTWYMNRTKNP